MTETRHPNLHRLFKHTRVVAAVLFLTLAALAQGPAARGIDSIRAAELRQRLTYFAGSEFHGRGDGSPDLKRAAQYIADVFQAAGVKPAAENGTYFQPFDLYAPRLGPGNSLRISSVTSAAADYAPASAALDSDYIPYMQSPNGNVKAPLVFTGYGIDAPSLGFRSPAGLRGRIAVVIDGFPNTGNKTSPFNAASVDDHVSIDAKANAMASDGALALIVIQNPEWTESYSLNMLQYAYNADLDLQDQWMFLAGDRTAPHIPVVVVSQAEGRRLVPDLATIRQRIDATPQNVSLPLEREASMQVEIERHVYPMQNVVGIIEGSDPVLKSEKVVIGAHYDHLGMQGGLTWYGADDDGSGDVALMALAGAFGNGSPAPRRSIVFAAWAGEEKGEYGSRDFVQSALSGHVVAMLQMDMIGRNEDHDARPDLGVPVENAANNARSLNIIGTIFSPDLKTVINRENAGSGLTLHYRYDWGGEDLERRSDHWNFLEQRIPAVFFFSGIHPDYHTPQDTADKINYPKIESVARLVYRTAEEIADNRATPHFVDPR